VSEEPRADEALEGAREPRPGVGLAATAWDWIRSVAIAFALFLVIRTFGVEAFKIPTSSMENTLLVGDFLLVNKATYGSEVPGLGLRLPPLREPRHGDVIVFSPPHEPDKNYVKRLVGVPGDTLEMRNKILFLNGLPLPEPYARYIDRAGDAVHPGMGWQSNHLIASPRRGYHPSRDNWGPLVVPPRRFFVLGDNRDNSEDSRYWGFVDRDSIRGRPWFVYYSFDPNAAVPSPWARAVRWGRVGRSID
jgi:signal peptidase I